MTNQLEALTAAAKKYSETLNAHRANPKDAAEAEAWDKASSELDTLINNNELDIVASLIAALEQSHAQSSKWLEAYHKAVSIGARYEERIAELEASQLAVKLPDEFAVIGENLRTQDNRITSDPLFCIFQKREMVTDADYDHDRIVWWHSDGYEATETQARRLELLNNDFRDTGEWRRLAVKEIDDFVTCCFTEKGCKDYLSINGHNLRYPFIYAKSGFRNNEYQAVRNWLMFAGVTVQGDE